MSDCLFCKIVEGTIPATKVYEDDLVVAFPDIAPQAPHHILIIPKKHITSALQISIEDEALVGHIYTVASQVADEMGFAKDGFRIVNNCGDNGQQTVQHLHFHVLGGRMMSWPPG